MPDVADEKYMGLGSVVGWNVCAHERERERVNYTSARSRHHVLACRSSAPAAEQPRINGMALWLMGNLLWPILGALVCLNIHGLMPCMQHASTA